MLINLIHFHWFTRYSLNSPLYTVIIFLFKNRTFWFYQSQIVHIDILKISIFLYIASYSCIHITNNFRPLSDEAYHSLTKLRYLLQSFIIVQPIRLSAIVVSRFQLFQIDSIRDFCLSLYFHSIWLCLQSSFILNP